MLNFLKAVAREVYERVILSHKSTLIGWALAIGVIVVNQLSLSLAGWSSPYASLIAMAVGAIGTFLKNRAAVEAAKAEAE